MPGRHSVTVRDGMKAALQPSLASLIMRVSAAKPAFFQTVKTITQQRNSQ
jgi:hypothetical protein